MPAVPGKSAPRGVRFPEESPAFRAGSFAASEDRFRGKPGFEVAGLIAVDHPDGGAEFLRKAGISDRKKTFQLGATLDHAAHQEKEARFSNPRAPQRDPTDPRHRPPRHGDHTGAVLSRKRRKRLREEPPRHEGDREISVGSFPNRFSRQSFFVDNAAFFRLNSALIPPVRKVKGIEMTTTETLPFYKRLWKAWLDIAHRIGVFNSRLLMTIFYFTVVLLYAPFIRLFSDPLHLRKRVSWWERRTKDLNLADARRQF
ncbi:MAG: hypothetical protein D6679_12315 [Candidatus Hydrogenedentota bacterium]|nr:MAG: hypothetical protein D6679_12315 [Candidatus Hydrogenedentota bacterium]